MYIKSFGGVTDAHLSKGSVAVVGFSKGASKNAYNVSDSKSNSDLFPEANPRERTDSCRRTMKIFWYGFHFKLN